MRIPLLIGIVTCLVLLIPPSSAQYILSIEDGWDSTDDVYASDDDLVTFADGLDGTYYIDSTPVDVLCIASNPPGFKRSQHYVINGHDTNNLVIWSYDNWTDITTSEPVHLQVRGGTSNQCRFYFWENKEAACPGFWGTSAAAYTGAGCPANITGTLAEGATFTYNISGNDYEITCAVATTESYLKCQADTYANLHDCQIDSGAGGLDSEALNETCGNDDSSSTDTDATCDVWDGTWDLKFLDPDHLTGPEADQYASGFHTHEFRIYAYTLCGTGFVDRDFLGYYNFTQLQSKQRVCTGEDFYAYNLTGYINSRQPWFTSTVNSSFIYNADSCAVGTLCQYSNVTTQDNFNLLLDACYDDQRSCYDGFQNRDEISVDYGGICGQCDNSSAGEDVYHGVAYQSHETGYFDINRFNNTVDCQEAEDSVSLVLGFVMVVQLALIIVFSIIVGAIAFFVATAFVTPIVRFGVRALSARRALRRGSNKKNDSNKSF